MAPRQELGRGLRLVYKPVMYCIQRQFEAVGDAELVKDIV